MKTLNLVGGNVNAMGGFANFYSSGSKFENNNMFQLLTK